jgi:glycolate oxidase FAD binding subunit
MLRLSGSSSAVQAAAAQLGGEAVDARQASDFWRGLREQRAAWFTASGPLWRLSVPSTAPPLQLAGEQLIEWGGGLRWLRTQLPAAAIRARAAELGGHATLFRGGDRTQGVFTPLSPAILAIHRRLKAQFDPAGIFNPGRLVAGL